MKIRAIYLIFTWSILFGMISSTLFSEPSNSEKFERKRKRIYLSGYVTYKDGGEPIEGATVGVKDTKLYSAANKQGFYQLDITELADSCKNFTILSVFVQCKITEIHFNYKVKKSTPVDIQMVSGSNKEREVVTYNKAPKKKKSK